MFESIKQNDQLDTLKYVSSLLLSLVVHVGLASVLILVPLVFCNALHPDELVTFLMAPPALPERPAPPVPPITASGRVHHPIGATVCSDCAPSVIPEKIQYVQPPIETEAAWSSVAVSLPDGLAFQNPEGGKGIEKYITQIARDKPLPPVHRTPPSPVIVVSSLQGSKLIFKPDPVYPKLAIATHTTGTVTLEAIINEEGNVTNLTVISGHMLLVEAARAAVLQWKYSPTILNGEAVPVRTLVTITFRIR